MFIVEWIWRMYTFSNEQGMHLNAKGVQLHNVLNKLNKITDVCCGIGNASSKMMTKSFVKQNLQDRQPIDSLRVELLPFPWQCGRRNELFRRTQPQQPTFHNCRSGQWQVMYYEGSHFTFWNEQWWPQQQTFHNCRSGQWQVMYYEGSHFTFWNEQWSPQQQTFHNCRYGQWQVMYYEGSHFTFWNNSGDHNNKPFTTVDRDIDR